MADTHISLPIYSLYDVPKDADEKSEDLKIPFRNEYFILEDLRAYTINGFYNKFNMKYIPGLSVMKSKNNQYINVKMGTKDLFDLLQKKWEEQGKTP